MGSIPNYLSKVLSKFYCKSKFFFILLILAIFLAIWFSEYFLISPIFRIGIAEEQIVHFSEQLTEENASAILTTIDTDNEQKVQNRSLEICLDLPPGKKEHRREIWKDGIPSMEKLLKAHPQVWNGTWKPAKCSPKIRIAILIPFRNRQSHLLAFLYHMHSFLQRQQADYHLFVINQILPINGIDKFNRAKLFNAGYLEVKKLMNGNIFDCFIFHDVDLVPENDLNLYRCCEDRPKHFISAYDEYGYNSNFGGVSGLTQSQFERINGFSNFFWGWGGEDDDISLRIKHVIGNFVQVGSPIGYYGNLKMAIKPNDTTNGLIKNACMKKLLSTTLKRMPSDGLNTLESGNAIGTYLLVGIHWHQLYTNITVDLKYAESIEMDDYPCKEEKDIEK